MGFIQARQLMKALFVACAICTLLGGAELRLASGGQPLADIVVPSKAHPAVTYAAEELQRWVREISGATLPIAETPSVEKSHIVLTVNPAGHENDLKAIGNTDGYAVRTSENGIILFATRPKGVLNGVFKMLFRNTDIIWARPDSEFGTSFSKNPDLTLTQIDYLDVPVYVLRGWQMGTGLMIPTEEWQVRNAQNWSAKSSRPMFAKFNHILEHGGGHNICTGYISEQKYYTTHPEFFPLKNGERLRFSKCHGGVQLCFTNKEMLKVFMNLVEENIRKAPNYDVYRIMIEDNYNLCECPECMKPIQLPDGTNLENTNPAFRSTQFFMFLNPIAKMMKEKYGKSILTFAYFFTETPPKIKLETNISISFCPIYKNSKYAVNTPENKLTFNRMTRWLDVTPNLTLREYYGLCKDFPRPIDVVAAADWRYANSRGINRTYSEMYADEDFQDGRASWDVNSMYFWMLANLPWNPSADVHELRNTFLTRVYGKAAPHVAEFYAAIEKNWFKAGGESKYNDNPRSNWIGVVIRPGITEQCKAALDKAAACCDKPNGKIMLQRLRAIFDKNTLNVKPHSFEARSVRKAPEFDPDFKDGDWKFARPSDNFQLFPQGRQPEKTVVKILYDKQNFYVGVRCDAPNLQKVTAMAPAGQPRDTWFGGEKFEMFVMGLDNDGKEVIYQFVVTPNGNIFDSKAKDPAWNGEFTSKLYKAEKSWSLLLTVPFKTLGYNEMPKMPSMSFIRYVSHDNTRSTVGYWNDCSPHNAGSFTEIIMK